MNEETNQDSGDKKSLREKISFIFSTFSPKERLVFFGLLWIFIISTVVVLWNINKTFLVEIPAEGGSLTEGVIGAPRFINPLLAISDADRDLTTLVYSGLLRVSESGELIPDLADSYTISEDGYEYTFTIRNDAVFHDGTKVTADDIIFTIEKAQDSRLKSPKRASWEGVVVEKLSDTEIRFVLEKPYAPFLENATMGILPKHIWKNAEPEQFSFSEFNIDPIGSGPYKIESIKKDSSGIPEYYDLTPFAKFTLGKPYINHLRIRFYANETELVEALKSGEVESINAISPGKAAELENKYRIVNNALPRVFAVFFNQNQNTVFIQEEVREALNEAIDRDRIINEVLAGYGHPIDGPIPPGSLGYVPPEQEVILSPTEDNEEVNEEEGEEAEEQAEPEEPKTRIERAREILENSGWSLNEEGIYEKKLKEGTALLSFSISTSDVSELRAVADIIATTWREVGADVEVKIFEIADLNQSVIRPREFDALLFGEIVGRNSDLFAFWHSSQRNDPGLNLTSYANITVDKLLEDVRTISDDEERLLKYSEFQEEIKNDIPAVFVYSPDFIYVVPEKLKGMDIEPVALPSERFLDIYNWYIHTDKVWNIFVNNTSQ